MDAPRSATLPDLADERARLAPDAIALAGPGGGRTYGELAHGARAVAAGLASLGVRRGDTVGLLAPNAPEWVDAALGAQAAGARVAGFNTWVKAWDLEHLLEHSGARVLVLTERAARNDLLGTLRELVPEAWEHSPGAWRSERFPELEHVVVLGKRAPPGALPWDALRASDAPAPAPASRPAPDEVAFVLYTSGSTAYPKAVPLLHGALVANGFAIGERMRLGPEDRVWLASPLFWSFGCANALMACLTHGAQLVLQGQFEPVEAARLLREHACTAAYLLPAITDALATEAGDEVRAVASLRTGVTIGRPDEVRRAAVELGVHEICNVYGSTETYGNCCVTPCDLPLERRLVTQGPPLEGDELRIVDGAGGSPLPPGEQGEIEVRGHVTPGYLGDPAATARAFTEDGWYRTGDLGSVDEDGSLSFAARATEMIKTSGINVSPAEVERFIRTLPGVTEVAVVGAPHPVRGEVVVAFVCAEEGAGLTPEGVTERCQASIASFQVPAVVLLRDELPRTDTGKLARKVLAQDASDATAEASAREER